jgi:two-component system response regulator
VLYLFIFAAVQWYTKQNKTIMLMEPAINLYSPNEKSELIRENYQEILSVLAAHQIALWEYDIITGKCSFSELGQEAINSFIRESPDLILMDIRMPVMDGIQATEKIRTISLTVPIIAVTAYAFYTEQQQAIQAGCNAVISKLYSLERLRETIESYIG